MTMTIVDVGKTSMAKSLKNKKKKTITVNDCFQKAVVELQIAYASSVTALSQISID